MIFLKQSSTGKLCKNCLECFACHAMKEPNIVGNCRPKSQRKCPRRERMIRVAEEHERKPTGGHHRSHISVVRPLTRTASPGSIPHIPTSRGKIENILPTPPAQPLIRTDNGISVSYAIKVPFTMSRDGNGRHIRFSHCPKLRFPSMQYAFDYFHVQQRLYDQRVNQDKWQQHSQAGQQNLDSQQSLRLTQQDVQATQQSQAVQQVHAAQPSIRAAQMHLPTDQQNHLEYLASARHNVPLKPNNGLFSVGIPTPPRSGGPESQYQHVIEPSVQNPWEERGPAYATGHMRRGWSWISRACGVHSSERARVRDSGNDDADVQGLQSWPLPPRATEGDSLLQSSSPKQPADQSMMLTDSYDPSLTYADTAPLQNLGNEVNISVQSTNPLPSSYANTVLPQTLNKKDRRVLGVPISAGVDETRAGFWLRDLQYTTDRNRAATLEERAIAALRLTRAQEAMDRLCGCSGKF